MQATCSHARIQEFSSGGVQVSLTKKALTFFFFFFFFFSPQLILQKSFFKVPEGVQHFPGRGSNSLFPIETHITCDFPGGVRTPCPPSGSALVQHVQIFTYKKHPISNGH